MATEQVPSTVSSLPSPQLQPVQAWLARLGLSGKILAIGGLAGAIAVFLPLMTMSLQMPSLGAGTPFAGKVNITMPSMNTSQSVMVIATRRGVVSLVAYLAAIGLSVALYLPGGLGQKNIYWASVAVGGFTLLLALWLLVTALNNSAGMSGFGMGLQASAGIGAYLNLLAAGAVTAGGFLKVREEKLI